MPKLRFESPRNLVPHPLLERVGMMQGLSDHFARRARKSGKNREDHKERSQELEGDWQALCASVRENGVLEPIKICRIPEGDCWGTVAGMWYIVDGRNRWNAAKEVDLRRVPVIRVSAEDAPAIIAATVAARRHYTKGATAYLACLLNPEFALAGEVRAKAGAPSVLSTGGLAAKFAVSVSLLEKAAKLFRLVEKHPHHRENVEAEIWAGCGLGGVISGLESLIAHGKKPEKTPAERKADLAWSSVRVIADEQRKLADRWADLSSDQRTEAGIQLQKAAGNLPLEIKLILKEAL